MDTIKGHLETCDECFCNCPIKIEVWKKAFKRSGFFADMMHESPADCNCFDDIEEKKVWFKKELGIIIYVDEDNIERAKLK